MTRNARTQEKRPSLCHAREGAAAGESEVEGRTPKPPRGDRTSRETKRLRADNFSARPGSNAESRATGARFEAHALAFLRRQRLEFVARNVHCRGGELDLVMRERDGTLVFVEVRARTRPGYGGAAASVGWHKQQRVLRASRYFLAMQAGRGHACDGERAMPPCRFDVIAFERGRLVWIRDAFRADGS